MNEGSPISKFVADTAPFGALSPFFRIIKEGLDGLVDGEDYFDLLAEDVVFEYVISVPGYPRRVEGRQSVVDLYSGYGTTWSWTARTTSVCTATRRRRWSF